VISGIGATEIRKFEGVKRWCEVRVPIVPFGDHLITAFADTDLTSLELWGSAVNKPDAEW